MKGAIANDPVERIGWAIIQELYSDVPEADRPQSWSDLSYDQNRRIECAAALALMMAKRDGPPRLINQDRRLLRAAKITSMLLAELRDLFAPGAQHLVGDRICRALYRAGAEIITEQDRASAGLPPRDENGWTEEELSIMELHLRAMMLAAVPMTPVSADEIKRSGLIPR
jgi:hypothetical protein